MSDLVRIEIEKRLDGIILREITRFEGTPKPCNLSKEHGGPLPYSQSTIFSRAKFNDSIADALEAKAPEKPLADTRLVYVPNFKIRQRNQRVDKLVARLRRA
jgi:hypothetical protein